MCLIFAVWLRNKLYCQQNFANYGRFSDFQTFLVRCTQALAHHSKNLSGMMGQGLVAINESKMEHPVEEPLMINGLE